MPINNITIDMLGHLRSSPDNEPHKAHTWSCPGGMYLEMSAIRVGKTPRPTTHPVSYCDWGKKDGPFVQCVDEHPRFGTCLSFRIRMVWEEGGGGLCISKRTRDAYGGDFRANCTNDASKVPLLVVQ